MDAQVSIIRTMYVSMYVCMYCSKLCPLSISSGGGTGEHGSTGQGLHGALFVLHSTTMSSNGSPCRSRRRSSPSPPVVVMELMVVVVVVVERCLHTSLTSQYNPLLNPVKPPRCAAFWKRVELDMQPKQQQLVLDKPIPAFYCCYLLRSRNHNSYYIGSTPNPARRLRQHNGVSKGGAKKTSAGDHRPWEMTCIVVGFPSRFAALQFEWAWQNTHVTRHIEKEIRDARMEKMKKTRKKPPQSPSKQKQKPPVSLKARLENLHYLLGVKSFQRWPLKLTFFSPDVFQKWELYSSKMDTSLRKSVPVQLIISDPELPPSPTDEQVYKIPSALCDIDPTYAGCKNHLHKSRELIESTSRLTCKICMSIIHHSEDLFLVCPLQGCPTVSHLGCLSRVFLEEEDNREAFIPTGGTCPGCHTVLPWITLVKELSLRKRGQDEIELLFEQKRERRKKKKNQVEIVSHRPVEEDEDDGADDLDDDWLFRVDEDEYVFPIETKCSSLADTTSGDVG